MLMLQACMVIPTPCNQVIYNSQQPPANAKYVVLVRNLAPNRAYAVDPSNNRDYYLAPKNGFCFFYFEAEPPVYIAFRNPYTGEVFWKCQLKKNRLKSRIFNGVYYNEEVVLTKVPDC